ncbi:MAG: hypothetical protein LDLANPLL_02125 [Turneriella sp.]|nr:hypothetical protein [Turneriella sp.]
MATVRDRVVALFAAAVAYALIALGIVDFALNVLNSVACLVYRKRLTQVDA